MNTDVTLVWTKEVAEGVVAALRFVPSRALTPVEREAAMLAKSDLEHRLNCVACGLPTAAPPPIQIHRPRTFKSRSGAAARGASPASLDGPAPVAVAGAPLGSAPGGTTVGLPPETDGQPTSALRVVGPARVGPLRPLEKCDHDGCYDDSGHWDGCAYYDSEANIP